MAEAPTRKLAVLLHADVVSSTALVRLNETVAHQRIQDTFRRLSETIVNHGGIAHEIRGDALIAEFAKALDAVMAAIAFQQANTAHNEALTDEFRPMVRVGIAMREVVIADNTVTGEGIVLAQRLEQLSEPGGVCIQDAAYQTVPKRLAFSYENLGERELKGFDEPVKVYAVSQRTELPAFDTETQSNGDATSPQLPDKPSIAVLPFTNMSGDPEQEYFSDGITEDIITELSRFPVLFVIARHSSFAFKGEKVDIKEVGQKLGVQYVIEGSVRRAGNRVRITVQLIDVETGNHVWADRYDRNSEDIFDVQDEVTEAIVSSLPGQLEKSISERSRRKRTESMTAYDCVLRGNQHYQRYSSNDLLEAGHLYEKAIELDPQFAQAHSRLAGVHNSLAFRGRETDENSEQALAVVQRALALDSNDGFARNSLGWSLLRRGSFDEAQEQLERAVALNPNDADTVAWAAHGLVLAGSAEKAYELISKAIRLNPLHPDIYHTHLGNAAFCTGRYEQAIREYKRGISSGAGYHFALAAAYGQMGQLEEARAEAAKYVEKQRQQLQSRNLPAPASDMEMAMERANRFGRQVDRDRLLDGLRKAGLGD